MASSNNDHQPAPFSVHDDDEAELANFDMYLNTHDHTPSNQPTGLPPPSSTNLQLLQNSFPSHDVEALSAVLVACDDDMKSARRLLQHSNTKATPPPPSKDDTNTSSDLAIARYLQRQESILAKQRNREARADVPPARAGVPPHVIQTTVNTLKEIVVPALRAHFSELVLPDTVQVESSVQGQDQGQTSAATAIEYELRNVQVAALTIPQENVSVRAAVDRRAIFLHVLVANVDLEVGSWRYRTRVASDAGRARASLHSLHIDMTLTATGSSWQFDVESCEVSVDGPVRFKTLGAAADWAYNALAVVFKPLLVSYVKQSVADAVRKAFRGVLTQIQQEPAASSSEADRALSSAQPSASVSASE